MEHLIHPQVRNIEVSGIRKMANRVSQYSDVLSLTLGQPDFPTPQPIIEAAKRAMDAGKTVYTANAGLPELRRAAAEYVRVKYGLDYDPASEVIVTVGASQALDMALRTIITPGSEVILPGPVYPGYEPLIRMCGGEPVHIDTTGTAFKLTADAIEKRITERTRCVILASPSNPTGAVFTPEELAEIAQRLADREIFLISDEIYSELVYGRQHVSIATLPGMRERTIVINGLSKSHSMTGWRIGFAFAPEPIAKHMVKVLQYNVSCASSISQYAALEAVTAGMDDALPMREEYVQRRNYAYQRLVDAGFDVVLPEGAFYIFPSVQKFGRTSQAFAYELLDQERVAVVPGDAFSPYGEGYIRISYACSMDVLSQAMDRITRFVSGL
jgi:aminotransferase